MSGVHSSLGQVLVGDLHDPRCARSLRGFRQSTRLYNPLYCQAPALAPFIIQPPLGIAAVDENTPYVVYSCSHKDDSPY